MYENIFKSTIDTTIRNFQYKYISRIIPTNTYLMKCNIKQSNICDFCSMHVESVKHLFWECTHTQSFWTALSTYLNSINFSTPIDYKTISLGICTTGSVNTILAKQFILTLAKYHIFKQKCKNNLPNINQFKHELTYKIEIEKIIAFKNDQLAIHNQKWNAFHEQ